MSLIPEEKTKVKNDLQAFNWLIYGSPKIGKSTFASQFDDALFIATEEGLNALEVFKISCNSWAKFGDILKDLEKELQKKEFKFKTIVIDTADNLLQYCMDIVCKEENIQHPSDKDWGKGWSLVSQRFEKGLNKLFRIINESKHKVSVVFISHSVERDIETRNITITKTMPTLSGKAGRLIIGLVDIIGYVGFDVSDATKRMVYFRGNESLEAGDRTGLLAPQMPFDFQAIKKAFQVKK